MQFGGGFVGLNVSACLGLFVAAVSFVLVAGWFWALHGVRGSFVLPGSWCLFGVGCVPSPMHGGRLSVFQLPRGEFSVPGPWGAFLRVNSLKWPNVRFFLPFTTNIGHFRRIWRNRVRLDC